MSNKVSAVVPPVEPNACTCVPDSLPHDKFLATAIMGLDRRPLGLLFAHFLRPKEQVEVDAFHLYCMERYVESVSKFVARHQLKLLRDTDIVLRHE